MLVVAGIFALAAILFLAHRWLSVDLFVFPVFLIAPLALSLIPGTEFQPLTWAKLYTLAISIALANALPHLSNEKRAWGYRFVFAILALNILEAVIADWIDGHFANAVAGLSLIATQPRPNAFSIGGRPARGRLLYDLPKSWILAYTVWNLAVMMAHYPHRLSNNIAVLAAPILIALWLRDHREWLYARAFTLTFYMVLVTFWFDSLGLPWFENAPPSPGAYTACLLLSIAFAVFNVSRAFAQRSTRAPKDQTLATDGL